MRVDVDQSLKSETNLNVGTTPSDETRTAYTYDGFGLTEPLDLRWVAVHLIEETVHHAGHADSTRELLDGKEMRAGATVKRERVVAAGVLCTRPGPLA